VIRLIDREDALPVNRGERHMDDEQVVFGQKGYSRTIEQR